jgi:hypothetical protein
MPFLEEPTRYRIYRRPSFLTRLWYWVCDTVDYWAWAVLIVASIYWALMIADAARAGRFPVGW